MKNPRPNNWLVGSVIDVAPFDAGEVPHSRAVQQGVCRWANEHASGEGQLEEIMTIEYPSGRRERHPVCQACRVDYQARAR